MTLKAIVRPGTVVTPAAMERWEEAMKLAPEGYGDGSHEMLPTAPVRDRCRLCGKVADLTREHIPPRVTGNNGQYRSFTFQEWLDREEGGLHLGGGKPGQGGVWGYTLCKECNELTGQRYVPEYKAWAVQADKVLRDAPSPRDRDSVADAPGLWFVCGAKTGGGGVAPGDFIREVLTLMCSLSGPWLLTERYPLIKRMILDREVGSLPGRMQVYMCFSWGPRVRLIGPQLMVDATTGDWAWMMEVASPPLGLLMVIDANHEFMSGGVDITKFTEQPPIQRFESFKVDDLVMTGFTWSPYPWDYRSSAALGYPSPIARHTAG